MNTMHIARLVAAKDLRIEWRSRVVTNQVLPFAALVMVMFAFALDNDTVLPRVAPGLVWLAAMFSLLVLVQRTFAVETADDALDDVRDAALAVADRAEDLQARRLGQQAEVVRHHLVQALEIGLHGFFGRCAYAQGRTYSESRAPRVKRNRDGAMAM